jgi:hypothetical protein
MPQTAGVKGWLRSAIGGEQLAGNSNQAALAKAGANHTQFACPLGVKA